MLISCYASYPARGTWIEMPAILSHAARQKVVPRTGYVDRNFERNEFLGTV